MAARDAVKAAEVRAGGGLELPSPYAGMLAHGGDLAQQTRGPDLANGLDFSSETELHLWHAVATLSLGLDYGATIEFEADTDEEVDTEETWIFLRGGWGESSFGDVDGAVKASAPGRRHDRGRDRWHRRRRR